MDDSDFDELDPTQRQELPSHTQLMKRKIGDEDEECDENDDEDYHEEYESESDSDFEHLSQHTTLCKPLDRTEFKDWKEFHVYFENYCKQTYQIFKVRTSTTIEQVNKSRKKVQYSFKNVLGSFCMVYTCSVNAFHLLTFRLFSERLYHR
jgi:hypothetical protein